MKSITILGGGIAGLTTAIALRRIGIASTVFEAAPEIRPVGAGLGLGANAIQAFKALGLRDELVARGRALNALSILDARGKVISRTQSASSTGNDTYAIHRAELQDLLLSHLAPGTLQLGKRAERITTKDDHVVVHFSDGTERPTGHVIAADGIGSMIRRSLVPGAEPRYAGYTCWRGVVDAPDLPLHEAVEIWGTRGRIGVVPLTHDRIYWFATITGPPKDAHLASYTVKDLQAHFGNYHDPVRSVLSRATDAGLIHGDIHDLDPLPHYAFGRVLLIGDAAHGTTPNLGQGACQAIEDAVVLAHMVQAHSDPQQAFVAFERARMERTRWITRTSRRIGVVAEWKNPVLTMLRDTLFRLMPPSVNQRQMNKVLNVRLEALPEIPSHGPGSFRS